MVCIASASRTTIVGVLHRSQHGLDELVTAPPCAAHARSDDDGVGPAREVGRRLARHLRRTRRRRPAAASRAPPGRRPRPQRQDPRPSRVCRRPAPIRSAAIPARTTAPGVTGEPPTTRTVPRTCLSPSSSTGSGHRSMRSAPMLSGSASRGSVRHRGATGASCAFVTGASSSSSGAVHASRSSASRPSRPVTYDVSEQFARRCAVLSASAVVLGEVLEQVADHHDHDLVGDDRGRVDRRARARSSRGTSAAAARRRPSSRRPGAGGRTCRAARAGVPRRGTSQRRPRA